MKFIDLHILPTSESVGKANTLLREAKHNLEEYGSTLDSENYQMVEGLLAIAKDSQVGLEDKGVFGRYQQAQECLQSAERTHKTIQQLIWGLY